MRYISVDPHTFPWDWYLAQPDDTSPEGYRPRMTYTVERTYQVRYGRHEVTRTYRIITTHPNPTTDTVVTTTNTPEEATS